MATENNERKKQPRFLALTGIGLQMGLTIFLFAQLGKYLDQKFLVERNYYTIGLTLLGVAISFYNLLKQVNRLNNNDDAKRND